MALSANNRGLLEQLIDNAIEIFPKGIGIYRDPKIKSHLQIKEENDYLFGVMTGYVMGGFSASFLLTNSRKPTPDELDEAMEILHKRAREFKDSIFSQG